MKELSNGVTLDETLRSQGNGYEITKDEARSVFMGDVQEITVHCVIHNCSSPVKPHNEIFEVSRGESGISIGCVNFSMADVEAVKEWLHAEPATEAQFNSQKEEVSNATKDSE